MMISFKDIENHKLSSYETKLIFTYLSLLSQEHKNMNELEEAISAATSYSDDSFFNVGIERGLETQEGFKQKLDHIKKGLIYLELLKNIANKDSYFDLPYEIRVYALHHFNLGERPETLSVKRSHSLNEETTEEISNLLEIIDKEVLPLLKIDYNNISLNE